jgi:hypothetical protein
MRALCRSFLVSPFPASIAQMIKFTLDSLSVPLDFKCFHLPGTVSLNSLAKNGVVI